MARRVILPFAAFGALFGALLGASSARAASVKGTVTIPDGVRARRFSGYWRVENGIVPTTPAATRETAILIAGPKGAPPAAKTVTVEIAGLEASPRILVLGPGSVVELKNGDRMAHEMGIPEAPQVGPIERLAPGALRKIRFGAPGAYIVRCLEYPSVSVSVLVVDSPHFALADERGAFSVTGVPDGAATLKVWSQGRWAHEQAIDVGKGGDVAVRITRTDKIEPTE